MNKHPFAFFCALGILVYQNEIFSSSENSFQPMQNQNDFLEGECCDSNWEIFADVLYWHMGEVGANPNSLLATTDVQNVLTTELNINDLDFGWDFGFRVGGEYRNAGCDLWNFSIYYTWYKTEAKNSGSFPGFVGFPSGFPLTGTLSDVDFLQLDWLFGSKSYHVRWNLSYNIFDLETSHDYCASETLFFSPYIGIRGGWINQDIDIDSIYLDDSNTSVPAEEKIQNHYWGIGPRCGLSSKWCLGSGCRHQFYLCGDLSGSFLWSYWKNTDYLTITNLSNANLHLKSRYAGAFMLQNLLGLEWNIQINCRGTSFSARISYESQYWFDHLQIFNGYNGRQHNALTLQGGTIDFRFNF